MAGAASCPRKLPSMSPQGQCTVRPQSLPGQSRVTRRARKTATWTNAPLVRSARGAGGARPEGGNPRIRASQDRRSGPRPIECAHSGLQEGRRAASRLSPPKLLAKRKRGRPWRSLRPFPCALAPPRHQPRISQTVPFFHVPVRAAGADTRAGQSNPAAAKTADEAPPRLLDDASIMRRSSRSPAFGDLHAARVSRSRRWPRKFPLHLAEVFDHDRSLHRSRQPPRRASLTRMSNELTSLRASATSSRGRRTPCSSTSKLSSTKCSRCRARFSRWRAR